MRKIRLVVIFLVSFFVIPSASAQGPTPPPSLVEVCYPEGKFHPVECAKAVWDATGIWGIVVLGLIFLAIFLVLSPGGKALQSLIQEKLGEWFGSFFKRPSLSEIQRREAETEYLLELDKSGALRQPDEIASRLDEYLTTLHNRENPLQPSEEKEFVELESGLSIQPRIGLAVKVASEQSKSFVEQKTFNSLDEAINFVDEQSGHPFPALALLGEPGAGKSTLLRKFARQMVKDRIVDPSKPLPIFVSLSAHKSGSPLMFLRQHWIKTLRFDGLEDALAEGRVWLFIDGLNEMPRANYDVRVTEWRNFLRKFCLEKGNRALIACRVADYGEGVDVPRLLIHPMNDERIQEFLNKRVPDRAEVLWKALEKDREEGRGAIYELSKTPFWLVMISRLSGKDGLPRNRADLIGRFIREWLDYESNRPQGRTPSDLQRNAFMEGMTQLAWTGLTKSQNYTFIQKEACKLLEAKQTSLKAEDILGLAHDCSLISEETDNLRFHHQLLQEYFAARELAQQFLAGKNLTKLWKTPWRRWKFVRSRWDPLPPPPLTGWEEAIILAAGMMDATQAENLTLHVVEHTPPLAARCVLESGAIIGDRTIETVKARLQSALQNPRVRLPARLAAGKMLAKLGDPRLLKRRGEVELTEGKKTAFIAPDWLDVPAGSFQMGTTPKQRFLLLLQRAQPTSDELHPHLVSLDAFKMARYPITVAEYRCFMDAGGYETDDYWKEENSLRWRNAPLPFEESYAAAQFKLYKENAERILPRLDTMVRQGRLSQPQADAVREYINSPDDDVRKQWEDNEKAKRDESGKVIHPWLWGDQQYTLDNQPVIGISWYEASAYAMWLTEVLRGQNTISENEEIRLPTESEWEKAARGNSGRLWAWGNVWNSSHANSLEGRVMQPSTVGAYPRNKSPYGIEDMIGNVWEWCSDWYDENEYRNRKEGIENPRGPQSGSARVLRGGSWYNLRYDARCSFRLRRGPDDFGDDVGFRLVCSPSFPTLNSDSLDSESLSK